MQTQHQRLIALIFFVLVVAAGAAGGVYTALNQEPSPLFKFLSMMTLTWAAFSWIKADTDSNPNLLPFDFGLFLYVLWPILGPWYLYRSRGFKGILWIVAILVSYVGATCIGFEALENY